MSKCELLANDKYEPLVRAVCTSYQCDVIVYRTEACARTRNGAKILFLYLLMNEQPIDVLLIEYI